MEGRCDLIVGRSAKLNNRALMAAAAEGHLDVVKLLAADVRVDRSASNNAALRVAAKNGHAAIVQFLLGDARVDPAANNNEAVRKACESGH